MPFVSVENQHSEIQTPDHYTGDVWNEIVASGEPPSRLLVGRATFSPGSRTAWHTHPHGQILVALSGIGRTQTEGEAVQELRPGDSVSVAPQQLHWHGAAPDRVFVHLAMQETTLDGVSADWHRHVTDDEYAFQPQGAVDSRSPGPVSDPDPTQEYRDEDSATNPEQFAPHIFLDGLVVNNADVRNFELVRARHALAYLKTNLGNERMAALVADDVSAMRERVQKWVSNSAGRWQSASVEFVVPGCASETFLQWYNSALAEDRQSELRAGHPEHFISRPRPDGIDVVENIGETDLPWSVFYRSLPAEADFPVAWNTHYPVRFGAEITDSDGVRLGFSMRQARDDQDGMHLLVTSFLPEAAPDQLMQRHLHHLAIEYRNWIRASISAAGRRISST